MHDKKKLRKNFCTYLEKLVVYDNDPKQKVDKVFYDSDPDAIIKLSWHRAGLVRESLAAAEYDSKIMAIEEPCSYLLGTARNVPQISKPSPLLSTGRQQASECRKALMSIHE